MTSTTREAPTFLLTPRQHLQWAERARRHKRPDLAQHHEQLARAIEIVERRQQQQRGRHDVNCARGFDISDDACAHRQWAENARRLNRPDLAFHHEQLARVIEIVPFRLSTVVRGA